MNYFLKDRLPTLRIVGIYAVVGFLWIYTSDTVLGWFVSDQQTMVKIAIYKGSFFIISTSLLLYLLVNRYRNKLAVSEHALKDQVKSLLEGEAIRSENELTIQRHAVDNAAFETSRKMAEVALRESEQKLRSIFDYSPIAIGIGVVHSGVMIEVNNAWLRLFGYVRDEVIGRTTKELALYARNEDRDEVLGIVKAQGSVVNHPIKLRHKSGKIMEIQYSADLITYDSTLCLQVMMTDNTNLKQAEDALKESEYRWKFALEGSGDAVWDWNIKTGQAFYSSRYKEMLGFAEDEIGSASDEWLKRIHPEDAPGVMTGLEPCLVGRTGSAAVEFRMLCKDGSWKWMLGRGMVVSRDSDGAPLRMIGTNADITDRKNAEEEKQTLEYQLQHTQKLESLGVLAGGIAHDFNNILAIIMGYCALTKLNYDTAEKNIHIIETAAEKAAGLCRQMMAYAGKAQLTKTNISMVEKVEEIVAMLKATLPQNAEIITDLPAEIPLIEGDASQLGQVVMNLIINSSEAIGTEHGKVDVSLSRIEVRAGKVFEDYHGKKIAPGEYVCLEVTDNGCGMSEETRWRIFEPFYTTKFTGRGLGMSAVLGIIRSHGGALQLYSQANHGTTFKVYLPVPMSEADREENVMESSTPDQWQGSGTVLLAEDEDSIRDIAKNFLELFGFTVLEAVNGQEALEMYRKNAAEITLVFTDMGMPVMDGYELFAELKKLNSELPIIVSSGYGDAEVTARIGSDNIAGIISKPYNPGQLRAVLKSVVNGS